MEITVTTVVAWLALGIGFWNIWVLVHMVRVIKGIRDVLGLMGALNSRSVLGDGKIDT